MRSTLTLCILLSLLTLALPSFAVTEAEYIRSVKKMERQSKALTDVFSQLSQAKTIYSGLSQKATDNLQFNAMKVYLKGALEVADKASAGDNILNAVLETAISVYTNEAWEPKLWTIRTQKTNTIQLHDDLLNASAKIRRMTGDLNAIIRAPLSVFDDDNNPMRSAKPWWRNADGVADDDIELTTRKTLIIMNLSERIARQFDYQMQQAVAQKRQLDEDIQAMHAAWKAEKDKDGTTGGRDYANVDPGSLLPPLSLFPKDWRMSFKSKTESVSGMKKVQALFELGDEFVGITVLTGKSSVAKVYETQQESWLNPKAKSLRQPAGYGESGYVVDQLAVYGNTDGIGRHLIWFRKGGLVVRLEGQPSNLVHKVAAFMAGR
ncbi:MAG: hypothetical protein KKB70_11515 [Proteobacteria bacterium]|nr:hypothetical protein [Pseudomonadota bacterium]MBU1611391.1 hypothetical protein [Pseudomonadota bacterium]